jgi:hypothetical protein
MEFLKIIQQQVEIVFSGKINLLLSHNKQLWGIFYIYRGEIVNVSYGPLVADQALFNLLYDYSFFVRKLDYVVEAELVSEKQRVWRLTFSQFAEKIYCFGQEISQLHRFRPPDYVFLSVVPTTPSLGNLINKQQRHVMQAIQSYPRVGELYKKSGLLSGDLTKALVSLRRMGIIQVQNN